MKIGVLALQGAFREHREVLEALGADAVEVRTPEQLGAVAGLILPGGESTTITKLLDTSGLREPLVGALADGLPAFGTCAGLIVLAREVLDGRPDQEPLAVIDVTARRNAYGRQINSFEAALEIKGLSGAPFPGVFIRAPVIEAVGPGVEVLAEHDGSAGPGARRCRLGLHVPSRAVGRSASPRTIPAGGRLMSGHSKWHSIKHAKGAADAARGRVFARLARQIEVAARQGGGDIEGNPTLRSMVQKARDSSMPKDNIERAIKRGTGELEGVTYETVNYEGYAPNGVAVYVETLTDNRNRTGSEVKNVFTRNGGSLAEPGAVSWQFERKGVIILDKAAVSEDDLMLAALEAGAEDIEDQGDTWQVTTPATELHAVRTALDEAGIAFMSSDLTMLPQQSVPLDDAASAKQVLRVIDALEDHDDVQNVYANFDIPDTVLQAVLA